MPSGMLPRHGHCVNYTLTREYRAWKYMRSRCNNPNDTWFADYGGRGIAVCPEWDSFERFIEDMGNAPSEHHSPDRIDVNGNYEPGNVRWADRKAQARNKRSSRYITYNGETKTLADWADTLGLNYDALQMRLNKLKWSVERAFTTPINHKMAPKAKNLLVFMYEGRHG